MVLKAAVILGSGSASFEMLRYLTEHAGVHTEVAGDADSADRNSRCAALSRRLRNAAAEMCRAFDIGGPEVLTYEQMMQRYAAVAGLPRRIVVKTPFLSPSLSSLGRTGHPVPGSIARPLVESLRNEVVVSRSRDIAQWIPDPPEGLLGFDEAVRLALTRIRDYDVATRWSSASAAGAPSDPLPTDPDWAGGSLYVDERSSVVDGEQGTTLACHRGHRRRERLVLLAARLAVRGIVDRLQGGLAFAVAGAIRTTCRSATPSTGGGSRRSMTPNCFACARKCGCRASRGSS